jgi:hypothetical protein
MRITGFLFFFIRILYMECEITICESFANSNITQKRKFGNKNSRHRCRESVVLRRRYEKGLYEILGVSPIAF